MSEGSDRGCVPHRWQGRRISLRRDRPFSNFTTRPGLWVLLFLLGSHRCGFAQPDNDVFAERPLLSGVSESITGATLDATRDVGESLPFGAGPGEASVWWSWISPQDGVVRVVAEDDEGVPVVAVRVCQGETLASLNAIRETETSSQRGTFFTALATQRYEISVVAPSEAPAFFKLRLDYVLPHSGVPGHLVDPFGDVEGTLEGAGPVPELPNRATYGPTLYWDWQAPSVGGLVVAPYPGDEGILLSIFRRSREDSTNFEYLAGGLVTQGIALVAQEASLITEAQQVYRFAVSGLGSRPAHFRFYHTWSPMRFTGIEPNAVVSGSNTLSLIVSDVPNNVAFASERVILESANATISITNSTPRDTLDWRTIEGGRHRASFDRYDSLGRHWIAAPLSFLVKPSNDDFGRAEVLSTDSDVRMVSTAEATLELGESGAGPNGKTVWYRWKARADGIASIQLGRMESSLPDPTSLDVFSGDSVTNLQPIAAVSANTDRVRRLLVPVHTGDTLQIRVSVADLSSDPAYLLLRFGPPLANDSFENRKSISGMALIEEYEAGFATSQAGELGEPTVQERVFRSAWYSWKAPATGELHIATESTDGSFVLPQVFVGSELSQLHRAATVRLDAKPNTRQLFHLVHEGVEYPIQIDSHQGTNVTGPSIARFLAEFIPSPANDLLTNATLVQGETIRAEGTLRGAWGESTGPGAVSSGARVVWYLWTAPRSATMQVALAAPDEIKAYIFADYNLRPYGIPEAIGAAKKLATFGARSNQTYFIAITQPRDRPGMDFTWYLFRWKAPANDQFINRLPVSGVNITLEANHEHATEEESEALKRSVWWTWKAPMTGWATLASHARPRFFVGIGDAWPGLVEVQTEAYLIGSHPDNFIWITGFECVVGTEYQIAAGRPDESIPYVYDINLDVTSWRLENPAPESVLPARIPVELQFSTPDPSLEGHLQSPIGLRSIGYVVGADVATSTNPPGIFKIPPTIGDENLFAFATNDLGWVRRSRPAKLSFREPPSPRPPYNDDFSKAEDLTVRGETVHVKFADATREPGEPLSPSGPEAGSVWFRWTPEYSGELSMGLTLCDSCSVVLYEGSELANLLPIASASDAIPVLVTQVTKGVPYSFAISGPSNRSMILPRPAVTALRLRGAPGQEIRFFDQRDFWVDLMAPPDEIEKVELLLNSKPIFASREFPFRLTLPSNLDVSYMDIAARATFKSWRLPQTTQPISVRWRSRNDFFAFREKLEGSESQFRANFVNATPEEGEPALDASHDGRTLWWTWTAPGDGVIMISGSSRLGLFEGDSLQSLGRVPTFSTGTEIRAEVHGGKAYCLLIAGTDGLKAANVNWIFASTNVPTDGGALVGSEAAFESEVGQSAGQTQQQSRFWRWTAPENGALGVGHASNSVAFGVSVVDLASPGESPLEQLVSEETMEQFQYDRVCSVQKGHHYKIALTTPADAIGKIRANLRWMPFAAKDDFIEAELMEGSSIWVAPDLRRATLEAGEPVERLGRSPEWLNGSVWISWTPPASGKARLEVSRTLDVTVSLGETLSALAIIGSNSVSYPTFDVEHGQTYRVAMAGLRFDTAPDRGYEIVHLALVQPESEAFPSVDMFASRAVVRGERLTLRGNTIGATRERLEPLHAGEYGGRSVWWSWTAPRSGLVQLRTFLLNGPLQMAVYQGTNLAHLVAVGVSAQIDGLPGSLFFDAQVGTEYSVALDGYHGAGVQAEIELTFRDDAATPRIQVEPVGTRTLRLHLEGTSGIAFGVDQSENLVQWAEISNGRFGVGEPWKDIPLSSDRASFFRISAK